MAPVEDGKWYSIHTYNEFEDNGVGYRAIDLNNGSSENGTHCQFWEYPDDENDQARYNMSWRAVIADKDMNTGTVYWSFQNRAGTTYMDMNHGSNDVGTMVQGWNTNGSNAQQWALIEAKGNDGKTTCWRIKNRASGTCCGFWGVPLNGVQLRGFWQSSDKPPAPGQGARDVSQLFLFKERNVSW